MQVLLLGAGTVTSRLNMQLAETLFGGTAEFVGLWFKAAGHESWFYWYVTACIACSLVVYATMRETRASSRIDADQAPSVANNRP